MSKETSKIAFNGATGVVTQEAWSHKARLAEGLGRERQIQTPLQGSTDYDLSHADDHTPAHRNTKT